MAEREKVIKAIGCCLEHQKTGFAKIVCRHDGCKFIEEDNCVLELLADILALLKAQEPRVMTLEEVKAFEWDYCYLEQERLPGKEYRMIAGDYALTCITWPSITSMRIEYGDNSYGVKWRCWTSRPDEKRRAETPWMKN